MFSIERSALLFICIIICTPTCMLAQKGDEVVGRWMVTDKNAIFEIYKENGKYYGKLKWTSLDPSDKNNSNPELRKRSLINATLMKDFYYDGCCTWKDGSIYNGDNGKTYSCQLKMKSQNELEVRGYIGIPLLGRTVIWTRVK